MPTQIIFKNPPQAFHESQKEAVGQYREDGTLSGCVDEGEGRLPAAQLCNLQQTTSIYFLLCLFKFNAGDCALAHLFGVQAPTFLGCARKCVLYSVILDTQELGAELDVHCTIS